jgi:hypothetical protein
MAVHGFVLVAGNRVTSGGSSGPSRQPPGGSPLGQLLHERGRALFDGMKGDATDSVMDGDCCFLTMVREGVVKQAAVFHSSSNRELQAAVELLRAYLPRD